MDVEEYLKDIDLELFQNILSFNLNVTKEKILILGDIGPNGNILSPLLSKAYEKAAKEMGLDVTILLQDSNIGGEHADPKVVSALKSLPKGSVIIMNMSEKIGKLGALGLSFRKFCNAQNHRFTSASGLGRIGNEHIPVILKALDIDYEGISEKAYMIKEVFDAATELQITTPKGTDVLFNIDEMKARVADGIYREPGTGGNIPGAETYIAPKKNLVDGKIVIDGSLRSRNGTKIVKTPIEMDIQKGVIVGMNDCEESKILEETLRWAHQKAKYPWGVRRIAEFGIGLNPKAKIIGCTVIDEKVLGTGHFAIGSNYWFGGSIYAIIHLDQVFNNPTVKADGKLLKL